MGGFDVKPGATTARDFSYAAQPESVPGKRSSAHELGEAWIDHGAKCAGRGGKPGCFLEQEQRDALIADFQHNVLGARENYKTALERIRVEQFIKKDEDLPWFLSLALDLAGVYFIGAFARALKTASGPGLAELQRLAGARQLAGKRSGLAPDTTWEARAQALLAKVTPEKVEAVAKTSFDPAKAAAKQSLAQVASGAPDLVERAQTVSYIDRLTNSCDVAFYRFRLDASGHADDAQLVVLWHGMKPQFHFITDYQAALAEKIERFKKSGANDVGAKDMRHVDGTLRRETRVIYVRDIHGEKVPWYERRVTDIHERGKSTTGKPQLDRPVPEEFRDIAIERSEQLFGPTPTIDDGYVQSLKANGLDVEAMRKRLDVHKPTKPPQAQTPVEAFVDAYNRSSDPAAPQPPGSVLAQPASAPYYAPGSVFNLPMQSAVPSAPRAPLWNMKP